MALAPQVRDTVSIPVIAGGGGGLTPAQPAGIIPAEHILRRLL